MTAPRAAQRKTTMTTFTIDTDNPIMAHATPEQAAATTTTPFDSFSSLPELAELAKAWPPKRLLAIWSSLPGVQPIRRFKDYTAAVPRMWERIQGLTEPVLPLAQAAQPKAARRAKGGARAAKSAPVKGAATHKATAAKKVPPAKKTAGAPKIAAPRQGSKTAHVVAMLQRKNGATLAEIMRTMGWQKHYADVQIMPTCVGNPAGGAVIAAMESA
jgi:hypothetical protein